MKIVVCLGNPGSSYVKTRHNSGFRVGEMLMSVASADGLKDKFKSRYCKGNLGGTDIIIIFPKTYMNLSGEAALAVVSWFKIPLSDMLVVYDDIDIDFGTLRFRKQGGPGTHNGLRSITQVLNSREFPRLRFGVGPAPKMPALADFVLSNFSKEEEMSMPNLVLKAIDTISMWVKEGDDAAMRLASGVSLETL